MKYNSTNAVSKTKNKYISNKHYNQDSGNLFILL
jgi:hypothetical protein